MCVRTREARSKLPWSFTLKFNKTLKLEDQTMAKLGFEHIETVTKSRGSLTPNELGGGLGKEVGQTNQE
ncbi:hypothetical protein Hanom_Chr03g00203331 [Helianthus anomalus]